MPTVLTLIEGVLLGIFLQPLASTMTWYSFPGLILESVNLNSTSLCQLFCSGLLTVDILVNVVMGDPLMVYVVSPLFLSLNVPLGSMILQRQYIFIIGVIN